MEEVTPAVETEEQARVIKEGWLYREESVQGSLSTWKKRWNVLTLFRLQCFKNSLETEPISSVPVASIEEMAHGANIGDKTYSFSLATPRGEIKLAAMDESERESWVATLRALVPKAKVELAKEMLLRKAKRKANLELAQQSIKEAIESILRDSKRVGVRNGFKAYADALAQNFQALLRVVDLVSAMGLHSARQTAYIVASIVDAANSAAAICSNRAIQDEIVVRTRDIAVDTAALLGHATTASKDPNALTEMNEVLADVQEQVREILEILAGAAFLQQQMDDAKNDIEITLENSFSQTPKNTTTTSVELQMDALADRAKALSTTIRNIANNACVTPDKVGLFSQDAASLMCELLEGTSVAAYSAGVDFSDPDYLAGTSAISPAKRLQMENLLASAKGFAAATTNMIDLLKQIPRQEDDENLQFRLSMATRSADNALNAFVNATESVKAGPTNGGMVDYSVSVADFDFGEDYIDAGVEVDNTFAEVQDIFAQFEVAQVEYTNPELTRPVETATYAAAGEFPAQISTVDAAKAMCATAVEFMGKAANSQAAIKRDDPFVYHKDPVWAKGMADAAHSMKDTTLQMYEVAITPDSDLEDIIAAARCVNSSTASVVAHTRAKADPDGVEQKELEEAARTMARMANFVIETAKKSQEDAATEKQYEADMEMMALRKATQKDQIMKEFEAQAAIAKLEAELEEARQYLVKLRGTIHGRSVV